MIPDVITEVAFDSNPNDAVPVWTDISAYTKSCSPTRGREDEYSACEPGTNVLVLRNNDRRFDPTYAAGPYYPNLLPNKRVRQWVEGAPLGLEFWGDFEQGADGTAPEWTAGNGAFDCKAGAEARQLQYVATPTPRLGARIARFEVASGDQFGASSGERAVVRRGRDNDAWPCGAPEGRTACYQFSFRPLAPWTHTSGWEIFQQFKADSRYGQPIFALETNVARTNFVVSVVTGNFATSGGATAGTGSTHNFDFTGPVFAADVWWDVRYQVKWTTKDTGFFRWWMKQSTSSDWVLYGERIMQTLPTTTGDSTPPDLSEQLGFYRNTQAITNVVFHDGYQVGHTWDDVDYTATVTDSRLNDTTWQGRPNILNEQGGNEDGSFENNTVGTSNTGGGATVITTSDTNRAKFGDYSLKVVTDGSASSQGVRHFKAGGSTRFDVTEGLDYTASVWVSSDTFQTWRIEIEFFDLGGSSLGTTQGLAKSTRTAFRRHWVTAAAPANAVTARIGTRWSGTTAGTFYIDGLGFWEGTMDTLLFEGNVDNWGTDWPDRLFQSDVTIQASDRFKRLAVRGQPVSNPNVEGYEEVINFSNPSFYYRLGEPEGTKLISHHRKKRKRHEDESKKHYKKHAIRHWKTKVTRAEVEGIAGPSGTYKNTPTLGEAGFIHGDPDTCVRFQAVSNEHARVGPLDQSDLIDTNRLTIECWVRFTFTSGIQMIVNGPFSTVAGNEVFKLYQDGGDLWGWIETVAGGAVSATAVGAITADVDYFLHMTWNGSSLALFVDTVELERTHFPGALRQGDPDEFMRFGADSIGFYMKGWLDEVAIYEKVLSQARMEAHFTAAGRGYDQEATGTRIQNVLDASGLGFPAVVDAGSREILPLRQFGQSSLDPIQEAEATEGGQSAFFFNAAGVATFLDRNYRDSYPYTENQASFGDLGDGTEIAYEDLGFDHGEIFLANIVRVEADGGETQEVQDADSIEAFDEANLEQTGLPMVSDTDALTEANWLLSRSKTPRWRIPSITFEVETNDRPEQTQQALIRELGDCVTVTRRPLGGASFEQVSSIERVQHAIDFERESWVTTFGLAPLADDLSTGWVLGVPGMTELQSTMVLN